VAVAIVELNGEHIGNDIIREQEHVVVGDGTDGVVVKYSAVLVADDDGDVLQFVGRGQHECVAVVAKHGQERGDVVRLWSIAIVISEMQLNTRGICTNKIPPQF